MKTFITLLLAVILFTACERHSRSGQKVPPINLTIKVRVMDTYPERIMDDTGLWRYKSKVIKDDKTVCFILTNNQFDNGDIIVIKVSEILTN